MTEAHPGVYFWLMFWFYTIINPDKTTIFKMQILAIILGDLSVSATQKWSTWSRALLLKVLSEDQQHQHTWEPVREGKTSDFPGLTESDSAFSQDPQVIHIHLTNLRSSDLKHRNFRNCSEFCLLKSFQQTFLWHHRSSKPIYISYFFYFWSLSMRS